MTLQELAKQIMVEILDRGLAKSSWKDQHETAYNDLMFYRHDLENSVLKIFNTYSYMLKGEQFNHTKPDKLVSIRKDGTIVGKRIAEDCPIPHKVAREYVKRGPLAAVKMLRDIGAVDSLSEAVKMLEEARGRKIGDN